MILTKRKKCEVCEAPITETKEFPETINMFDINADQLTGQLLIEINEWRSKKIYCDGHINQLV